MQSGILIINYEDGITDTDIKRIIGHFYEANKSHIGGMSYYHTDSEELIKLIRDECEV